MAIRCRPMRSKDVGPCVDIIARHPFIGPRYGTTLANLAPVWLSLLGCEAFRAYVYEELQGSPPRLIGIGCSAIITDDFLREAKTPPFFWIGAELTRRIHRGQSPLLSDRQVREANSDGGINVTVWDGAVSVADMHRPEVSYSFLSTFIQLHRGFLLKEIVGQGSTDDTLAAVLRAGYLYISGTDGRYTETIDKPPHELIREPHMTGLSRDLAPARIGTWASTLFIYQPPRFGFTPSEQRLLLAALLGGTDEELADELGISLSAVKKAWHSIYERVSACDPDLTPPVAPAEEGSAERGRMKKQRLIVYLRDHPEELRPAREN
jgi:DNA-binding CsgD family transcriptional regulator